MLRLAIPCLVAIFAAALAVFFATSASNAGSSAALIYVDGTGDCASLTPCFTTIQQAVRLVEATDTEIRVFPGTYNESVDLDQAAADTGGTFGDLSIVSVDATGTEAPGAVVNGGDGPAFLTTTAFDADLTIDGFTVISAGDDGISVEADGGITVHDVTANSTGGDGVNASSNDGDILVANTSAQRSVASVGSPDGLDLFTANGDVTVTGVSANNHNGPDGSNGIEIETANGNVLVHNSLGNFNADQGIVIDAQGDVHVSAAGAVGNGEDGLDINTSHSAVVDFFGSSDNGDSGSDITAFDDAEIRDSFAKNNAGAGIQVGITGDLYIERVTVEGNNTAEATASGGHSGGIEVVAHPDAEEPLVDTVSITGSAVWGNSADGILLTGTHGTAPVTVTSNAICQNAGAGFAAFLEIPANLTNNWWGETTGPTHPDNPGGGGDEIEYYQGGGMFDPWITFIEGEVVSPLARAGSPSEIAFTSTNTDNSGGLEEGLGWPAEFEATTDNGVLSSDVPGQAPGPSVAAQFEEGVMTLQLTAAEAGNAIVDLTGPCGLGGELNAAVEAVRLFGDVDCNLAVNAVDSLKELRYDAGLSVAQEPGCPPFGEAFPAGEAGPLWGDVDCDGIIGPVDGLKLLRFDAGLSVSQEEDCPPIGEPLP
jgi:hypothetical protein